MGTNGQQMAVARQRSFETHERREEEAALQGMNEKLFKMLVVEPHLVTSHMKVD